MKTFPEFEEEGHEKLIRLDEDVMKSKDGKEKWRVFINSCGYSLCIHIHG